MRALNILVGPGLVAWASSFGCGSVKDTPVDAPAADAAAVDAPDPVCGDGRRDPGEICFGAPLLFAGGDVTYDAHLADQDGDGDLDLVFLIGDQYKFFLQNQGQFAGTAINGPTTFARFARSLDLGGSARLELVDAGDGGVTTWAVAAGMMGYTQVGSTTEMGSVKGMAIANITGGASPNVVTLYGQALRLSTYGSGLTMTTVGGGSPSGSRALVAARLDADAFADVVVAAAGGVLVYRGMSGGLGQTTNTPQTAATDAVAVGDVDQDGLADIGFAIAGTNGQLGVMRGVGGAAFLAATTSVVASLGAVLQAADIDGDGRSDLIGAQVGVGTNAVVIALGQADGTVAATVSLPISVQADYIRADADFNGDGAPDLVITNSNSETIVLLPSNP